ncbi:MAG: GNAT family N-acetyltransferase [Bacteroidetes bacterium]|nr:GNAT family N-acetyltransferase [Bacteroidota bacterium]MBS1650132.1 GNAT family N-acetyltransferase [Bacteroidota bacterium]
MLHEIIIRAIEVKDNAAIAKIIRDALEEFKANKPGTVYFDKTTDNLFELFTSTHKSKYFIAVLNEKVIGGAGIFPTEGLPNETCELVKMYLAKEVRGLGLGRKMIEICLQSAKQNGYRKIYLESMPELKNALAVYEKFGFEYLSNPLGNSGHCGCDLWMLKEL